MGNKIPTHCILVGLFYHKHALLNILLPEIYFDAGKIREGMDSGFIRNSIIIPLYIEKKGWI